MHDYSLFFQGCQLRKHGCGHFIIAPKEALNPATYYLSLFMNFSPTWQQTNEVYWAKLDRKTYRELAPIFDPTWYKKLG